MKGWLLLIAHVWVLVGKVVKSCVELASWLTPLRFPFFPLFLPPAILDKQLQRSDDEWDESADFPETRRRSP
jgi:hypothetical protein